MTKELADRPEELRGFLAEQNLNIYACAVDEAIAALRSEPVVWIPHGVKREDVCVWVQDSDGPWNTSCGKVFEFTNEGPAENEANFCYHCGGALLPEPYSDAAPSRETDQRECSPAPVDEHGLTELRSGAPTPTAEPAQKITGVSVSVACLEESNGKKTWSVMLLRDGDEFWNGHQIYSSESEGRALYEADSLRHYLDPSEPEPDILAYQTDLPKEVHQTEPALSAETIKAVRKHWDNCSDVVALCNMALSSLTARHTDEDIAESYRKGHEQGALTARDEGIEAVLNDEALHLSDRQRSRVRNLKGQP